MLTKFQLVSEHETVKFMMDGSIILSDDIDDSEPMFVQQDIVDGGLVFSLGGNNCEYNPIALCNFVEDRIANHCYRISFTM